ncbi:uncharacterized protein PGTG_22599 [Puccinia graminis f. sp. tritici CRL 75-36-700-3]|uniref:Uncharacterized protein n=1 Tax=Puccinia graminis f. sp. tritici (strain CRL 75-36-700-3 / race SCCL) TaxID=418459 RepID=H6QV11_PUCGT|nr:uncharacterized protein PGTG_22599 [Puccinia graminis f. sp. tritici CRL 75-36-700-3]EHS62624.1 hypothetical protein PGTG_22599 [Puccinia graminis f. sp. tritici CRL 75-36-700-3]
MALMIRWPACAAPKEQMGGCNSGGTESSEDIRVAGRTWSSNYCASSKWTVTEAYQGTQPTEFSTSAVAGRRDREALNA